jgi:hypothetical protein
MILSSQHSFVKDHISAVIRNPPLAAPQQFLPREADTQDSRARR